MSIVLTLDIASTTGFSVFDSNNPLKPVEFGTITLDKRAKDHGQHPWGYFIAAQKLGFKLVEKILQISPDVVVVEETNGGGRSRFVQKFLEYCHFAFLLEFLNKTKEIKLVYVNTSDWRKSMDVRLTKNDKKQNAKLSLSKRKALNCGTKLDKKILGIKGKTTIKHVAIRRANELFNLELIAKDDDIADALLIGAAYLNGVVICNGAK